MNPKAVNRNMLEEFSLVQGGPLYRLHQFTKLCSPPLQHCLRRAAILSAITWLPLFFLSYLNGTFFNKVEVPFAWDIATHLRLLASLPLLILAEPTTHFYIQLVIKQFIDRGLIYPENIPQFDRIIRSCTRFRDSSISELVLLASIGIISPWTWKAFRESTSSSWLNSSHSLSAAGYWCAFISMPIFQFILVRWYFRLSVWYQFLWQVSKLPLRLNSLHPDKSAGLGFLGSSVFAFGMMLLAQSILLAGVTFNKILFSGASLGEFKLEIAGFILFLVILVFTPIVFFSGKLFRSKRNGTWEYGVTASRYVNDFREKWIQPNEKSNEKILGSPDLQSLADLGNSFEISDHMRIFAFKKSTVIGLIIFISIPFFPLIFTIIPLEEMIKTLMKIIL